jgi:hypothetical protein
MGPITAGSTDSLWLGIETPPVRNRPVKTQTLSQASVYLWRINT